MFAFDVEKTNDYGVGGVGVVVTANLMRGSSMMTLLQCTGYDQKQF